ncbi:MAG: anthranilate synthase component I family protein [Phycisphaerales bacterium]|nr:anthranilate synthase component I family protein [Phycisphaerales bacterium]
MSRPAWIAIETDWPAMIERVVAALAGLEELAWLDSSAAEGHDTDSAVRVGATKEQSAPRFSLIAVSPRAHISVSLPADGGAAEAAKSGWERLVRAVREYPPAESNGDIPELIRTAPLPGWVGYIGYEMAAGLERVPIHPAGRASLPAMRFALFPRGIVLEHATRRAWAIGCIRERSDENALRELATRWKTAVAAVEGENKTAASGMAAGETWEPTLPAQVVHETTAAEHARWIEQAREYIRAGDIYQVNLAHRLRLSFAEFCGGAHARRDAAMRIYSRLRRKNPAGFAALLSWEGGAIASVSPERFLELRGRSVLTSPIKGTRPRVHKPAADRAAVESLRASAKDAAELAMIVDLHRNDLGRVCIPGTVRVSDPRRVEAHPTVFHTVADVRGELRPGLDALDLLRACFPAGSVTGVPKIRAMQIIHELEPAPRGAYTGAIGVISLNGGVSLSVAIRTLQLTGNEALLHVGGGIVADSRADEEYAETIAKGRGILGALSAEPSPRSLQDHTKNMNVTTTNSGTRIATE